MNDLSLKGPTARERLQGGLFGRAFELRDPPPHP